MALLLSLLLLLYLFLSVLKHIEFQVSLCFNFGNFLLFLRTIILSWNHIQIVFNKICNALWNCSTRLILKWVNTKSFATFKRNGKKSMWSLWITNGNWTIIVQRTTRKKGGEGERIWEWIARVTRCLYTFIRFVCCLCRQTFEILFSFAYKYTLNTFTQTPLHRC